MTKKNSATFTQNMQNVSNNKEFGHLVKLALKLGNIVPKLKKNIRLPPVVANEKGGALGLSLEPC